MSHPYIVEYTGTYNDLEAFLIEGKWDIITGIMVGSKEYGKVALTISDSVSVILLRDKKLVLIIGYERPLTNATCISFYRRSFWRQTLKIGLDYSDLTDNHFKMGFLDKPYYSYASRNNTLQFTWARKNISKILPALDSQVNLHCTNITTHQVNTIHTTTAAFLLETLRAFNSGASVYEKNNMYMDISNIESILSSLADLIPVTISFIGKNVSLGYVIADPVNNTQGFLVDTYANTLHFAIPVLAGYLDSNGNTIYISRSVTVKFSYLLDYYDWLLYPTIAKTLAIHDIHYLDYEITFTTNLAWSTTITSLDLNEDNTYIEYRNTRRSASQYVYDIANYDMNLYLNTTADQINAVATLIAITKVITLVSSTFYSDEEIEEFNLTKSPLPYQEGDVYRIVSSNYILNSWKKSNYTAGGTYLLDKYYTESGDYEIDRDQRAYTSYVTSDLKGHKIHIRKTSSSQPEIVGVIAFDNGKLVSSTVSSQVGDMRKVFNTYHGSLTKDTVAQALTQDYEILNQVYTSISYTKTTQVRLQWGYNPNNNNNYKYAQEIHRFEGIHDFTDTFYPPSAKVTKIALTIRQFLSPEVEQYTNMHQYKATDLSINGMAYGYKATSVTQIKSHPYSADGLGNIILDMDRYYYLINSEGTILETCKLSGAGNRDTYDLINTVLGATNYRIITYYIDAQTDLEYYYHSVVLGKSDAEFDALMLTKYGSTTRPSSQYASDIIDKLEQVYNSLIPRIEHNTFMTLQLFITNYKNSNVDTYIMLDEIDPYAALS